MEFLSEVQVQSSRVEHNLSVQRGPHKSAVQDSDRTEAMHKPDGDGPHCTGSHEQLGSESASDTFISPVVSMLLQYVHKQSSA